MDSCKKCGGEIFEADRFCRVCGEPVEREASGSGGPQSPAEVSGEDESLRANAEKRVKARLELLQHIGMYIVVNGFLIVIWALTGAGYPWFLWVVAGWGLGVAIHIVTYFTGKRGESTKQKMIEEEMKKIRREKG